MNASWVWWYMSVIPVIRSGGKKITVHEWLRQKSTLYMKKKLKAKGLGM
jgi:hypothetical protein